MSSLLGRLPLLHSCSPFSAPFPNLLLPWPRRWPQQEPFSEAAAATRRRSLFPFSLSQADALSISSGLGYWVVSASPPHVKAGSVEEFPTTSSFPSVFRPCCSVCPTQSGFPSLPFMHEDTRGKKQRFFGGFERPSKSDRLAFVLGWGSGRPKARESAQRPFSAFMQIPPGKEKGRGRPKGFPSSPDLPFSPRRNA